MTRVLTCPDPSCGKSLRLKADLAPGCSIRCPACGQLFRPDTPPTLDDGPGFADGAGADVSPSLPLSAPSHARDPDAPPAARPGTPTLDLPLDEPVIARVDRPPDTQDHPSAPRVPAAAASGAGADHVSVPGYEIEGVLGRGG